MLLVGAVCLLEICSCLPYIGALLHPLVTVPSSALLIYYALHEYRGSIGEQFLREHLLKDVVALVSPLSRTRKWNQFTLSVPDTQLQSTRVHLNRRRLPNIARLLRRNRHTDRYVVVEQSRVDDDQLQAQQHDEARADTHAS